MRMSGFGEGLAKAVRDNKSSNGMVKRFIAKKGGRTRYRFITIIHFPGKMSRKNAHRVAVVLFCRGQAPRQLKSF